MSWQTDDVVQKRLRLGAVGSLGAVTLLWLACQAPTLFPLGTALLTVSMVPLAAGFRARGGLLLGMLFGVLWVVAKLGVTGPLSGGEVLNVANVGSALAIAILGTLSGAFFGLPTPRGSGRGSAATVSSHDLGARATRMFLTKGGEEQIRDALGRYRDWMSEWDHQDDPWASFDTHVRELLRQLVGARRVRCYRLSGSGQLRPLNGANDADVGSLSDEGGLLDHVLTSKRRFVASSPNTGELLRELASASEVAYAWALPIRDEQRSCGLITVGEFEDESVGEERLDLAADLVEEFWVHLRRADALRVARLVDRPSGVLNRVEILAVLDRTVEECYAAQEPVVMLALVVEGIRSMDDGGQWEIRNEVIEAIGHTMRARLRHDDVLGRFSDDRFVAVLRRLDVSLAHLITRKILGAAEAEFHRRLPGMPLTLRAGLAGSGLDPVPPQVLLLRAFDEIAEARNRDVELMPRSKESSTVAEKA